VAKPMTSEYKFVFAVTIFVAILTFVLGAINGRVGPSFLLWCYLSWLTYKRESAKLISWFNFMLIILSIAVGIIVLMSVIYEEGAYGIGLDTLFDCLIGMGLAYWLKIFHAKKTRK
jgi:hypothetical protein